MPCDVRTEEMRAYHEAENEPTLGTDGPIYADGRQGCAKLSETPGSIRSVSPSLGQHNEEIYRDLLKMTPARWDELGLKQVI